MRAGCRGGQHSAMSRFWACRHRIGKYADNWPGQTSPAHDICHHSASLPLSSGSNSCVLTVLSRGVFPMLQFISPYPLAPAHAVDYLLPIDCHETVTEKRRGRTASIQVADLACPRAGWPGSWHCTGIRTNLSTVVCDFESQIQWFGEERCATRLSAYRTAVGVLLILFHQNGGHLGSFKGKTVR